MERPRTSIIVATIGGAALVGGALINTRCAADKPPSPVSATAASGSNSSANPSSAAIASPNITVSPTLSVTVPPPAPVTATHAGPTINKYEVRSDHQSGGVTAGQYIYEGADKDELKKVKAQLEAVRDYADISRLTFKGLPLEFSGGGDIEYKTDLSTSMKPAFEDVDHTHFHFICTDTALAALHKTKARFPKFPFSYYGLAFCLSKAGDASWRDAGLTAKGILAKTTTISGHAPDHDQAFKELSAALPGQ